MRANKEARKREMEEMERMKAQLLEEEASISSGVRKYSNVIKTGWRRKQVFYLGEVFVGEKRIQKSLKEVGGGSKYFYLGESICEWKSIQKS